MSGDSPTIAVVDDAADVRTLVRTRLRLSGRFHVVGEGGDGFQAVALAKQHRPALMLLDVSMPGMDGLAALPQVLEQSPRTRVVVYSGFEEEGLAQEALRLGASAFVKKSTSIAALVEALEGVLGEGAGEAAGEPPGEPAGAAHEPVDTVLAEHLERFREVFDEAAIGMATMTLTGRVVRANRALGRLLGRSAADLVGQPYADLAVGARQEFEQALRDVRRRDVDLFHVEHEVDGLPCPRLVSATLAPVRDSRRRALYVFLQVQDVTVERAAQEQLRRSEERFRLLISAVEDYAIFMLDTEGRVTSWNAGAQRSKGYTRDEIVGRHFRTFYPPEVQESGHPEHELEIALREGHYEEEGWRVRKDGTRFWANVVITAVHDDDGRHIGFAKVTRDVTDRRQAEEALRQSEERFRLLVETVQDYAIFMLDPDGRIVSWNAGAERTKGYTADEIIGQHLRIFYPPEKQAERHPEHELELALRDGRYEEEGWRIRKDGTRFWANVVITAVFKEPGVHVGFAKVTRDISERRELTERLRRAAEDQAQFLAVTAHELRTPVGVLGGTAETLAQYWTRLSEAERDEMLAGMTSSANRLRRLLADLLTASRLQSRALQLTLQEVDLAEVMETAAATTRGTQPDAVIEVHVAPDLLVIADRDRLEQVMENLLRNSVHHGVPPVVVEAEVGAVATIRVSDAGLGVPPEVLPRLFERFATGERKSGTGLGLFIARELTRAQGGDLVYEPDPVAATGGAFVVTLPVGGPPPGPRPSLQT
jgi:PAS domain S-box-containing protein